MRVACILQHAKKVENRNEIKQKYEKFLSFFFRFFVLFFAAKVHSRNQVNWIYANAMYNYCNNM